MGDSKWLRSGFVWIILIIAVIALWFTFVNGNSTTTTKNFNDVVEEINKGEVAELSQSQGSSTIRVTYTGGTGKRAAKTVLPPGTNIYEALENYDVSPTA